MTIIQKFKQETLTYLAEQGYPNLDWDTIIMLYNRFEDDPAPGLENEIDSCFALTEDDPNYEILSQFIAQEVKQFQLSNFEAELIQFIKNHPYTQKLADGYITIEHNPEYDSTNIELHTVDGEYERIQISLNCIP